MFLLEHDAKTLLALHGAPVPRGVLLDRVGIDAAGLPPPPWIVKAQIATGGRGKAGLIRTATTGSELESHLREILGATHKGMTVRACRIETQVTGVEEAYLSYTLDPVAAGVRVIMSARGGVDIESLAAIPGAIRSATVAPQLPALVAQAAQLTTGFAPHVASALDAAARELARVFMEAELSLLEINPLFVRRDGGWIAGDAKIVTDDNALFRQPQLRALLASRAVAYPEAQRKQEHGCDYVVVDPGLSMMLIDELRAAGLKPYNFLDVRTGGLRGDAMRLVSVLNWIAEGRRVRVLLVNIFAGITDLGEFARLLTEAFARTPQLKVPVVARLVGTGLDTARKFLAGRDIPVVTDLGAALDQVRRHLAP
jgi:succinyl-CoA synthetase beta subunit